MRPTRYQAVRAADGATEGRSMSLLSWLRGVAPSEADIRAEIWRLGARHRGEPLDGALAELNTAGLPAARVVLLRACVQKLRV